MSRHLLQNIRDSGCVDMESLCILSREHVKILINKYDFSNNSFVPSRFGK